mmetsp:Transcript_41017/g.109695  ORF Transcript_41017/g.109695 Transcript_41017/m.109695 type:complete len:224 (+) Transcript_41017:89-760(+)
MLSHGSSHLQVHLITDNAGLEFVSDLALAHYLLSLGPDHVAVVQLHLKPYPFFVSDATSTDLDHTLALLSADATPGAAQFAQDLRRALSEGRLVAGGTGAVSRAATTPQAWWHMDAQARAELAAASLVVAKGDLMYRKMLGDRPFPTDTPFSKLLAYFPCPLLALRTCKAPLAVGLSTAAEQDVGRRRPNWRTSGCCGLVQFADPPSISSVDEFADRLVIHMA